jgi:microcystin-dependent protein
MPEPFLSEIRMFSFNYAPQGWAQCNGQLLPINQNQALFSLLGTTYGGNGQTTFALPNLRGRVPMHFGDGLNLGETAGQENQTLTISEMPTHTHFLQGNVATNATATQGTPNGNYWANSGKLVYSTSPPDSAMSPATVTNIGGSQPHANMSPYLVINFCIALIGIFPSRN